CKSPAVRGTALCFHHTPHENIKRHKGHDYDSFELPDLSDKCGILIAVTEILNRLAQHRIRRSEAETLLEGLKFLDRLMTEIDQGAEPYCSKDDDLIQQPAPSQQTERKQQPARTPQLERTQQEPSFEQMLQSLAAMASELGLPEFNEKVGPGGKMNVG